MLFLISEVENKTISASETVNRYLRTRSAIIHNIQIVSVCLCVRV